MFRYIFSGQLGSLSKAPVSLNISRVQQDPRISGDGSITRGG